MDGALLDKMHIIMHGFCAHRLMSFLYVTQTKVYAKSIDMSCVGYMVFWAVSKKSVVNNTKVICYAVKVSEIQIQTYLLRLGNFQ